MEIKHRNLDSSSASPHLGDEFDIGIRENRKLEFPFVQSNKSRVLGKLRYWWSWTAAGTLLLVLGVPTLIFLGLIRRKMWLYPVARFGANLWLRACGATIKVTGTENLQEGRQYVFASNHRSYLDTATLFFHTGRKMGLVAKKELLKAPVLGQGMHYVNVFAIDRSNPERARQSMEKARKVIEAGYSFGIFVEGTRALPGQLLPFKKGAFHLALQTGADVIPVAMKNTDVMMGKRTGVAYGGTIEMVLLPPVRTEGREMMDILIETRRAIANELKIPSEN